MYLKSLEVQGFKSFPDKTILNFGSDITAIVGPNGSGKSNISDAISWVMGEQSTKALRGGKMEDVIFGGTLKRAQVGFAEASLILDNTDGSFPIDTNEVMVTRRYYRSGESEYYINKQSARLRDIHELFMDTGLGREGYSNIGQGRIDEILSLKSTDRREVFEEAAGISKYRHRKEETERRLANTQENLTRIGDKISELELQIGPLQKQADQAQKYLSYKDQMKGLEVTVWLDSLNKLAAAVQKAEADFHSAEFILEQTKEESAALYAQMESLGQQLRQEDQKLEQIRTQKGELELQLQKKDGDISLTEAARDNHMQTIERIRLELTEQDSRSSGLQQQITEKVEQALQLDARLAELTLQLSQLADQAEELANASGSAEKNLILLQSQQAGLTADLAKKTAELSAMSYQLSDVETRKAALDAAAAQATEKFDEASKSYETCQAELAAAGERVVEANNRIAGYQLRTKTRKEKQLTLAEQVADLDVSLKTITSKLRMLEAMERDYEGYTKTVKQVMQESERGGLSNLLGPVSRVIRVEDRYAVAIEIALGAAMQQIIVEREEDAKAAILYLKRRNIGRATFLPISSINGKTLQERNLESMPGYVGIGSQVVSCEEKFRSIIDYLLGRTVLVESLDYAIPMAKKYSNRFKIVTLDGQVINAGGSMTGGSFARDAGILSRANELKKLREAVSREEKKRAEATALLEEAARQAAEAEFQLTTAQGDLRQAEDEVLRLEGERNQCTLLMTTAQERIDQCKLELVALDDRSRDDRSKSQVLESEITAVRSQLETLQVGIDSAKSGHLGLEEQARNVSQSISDVRSEMAACEAERTASEGTRQQLQQLQMQLQGDYAQKHAVITQFEQQIQDCEQQIAARIEEKKQLQCLLEQTEATLIQTQKARMHVEAQKTQTEHETHENNKNLILLERESARLEQKMTTASLEEKQIIDKLWDTYGLTRSTAESALVAVESIAAANRQIAELRRKISALGTPNLGAIDEFARVHERYEYLTGQRDDVLHAKRELENIVATITAEMTEIFVREFAKINTFFSQTFAEMFGGGKASLELENPGQPLSCGIEIKVQPPGKQLKTITLLSGGEKAFVAIALYFAILKVRPTPFCMLDEIDAALDDRNVERFAGYLRNLCDKTQFIVITHRRGTMEASDTLYGVTMQEEGVSKILHLDLNQMDQQLRLTK